VEWKTNTHSQRYIAVFEGPRFFYRTPHIMGASVGARGSLLAIDVFRFF
jgi:hypothetical protein